MTLTAVVLGITAAMLSVSVSADVVNFPDPSLEGAVRSLIECDLHPYQEPPGWEILESDLVGLTSLDIWDTGISDLTGIEYCVDLMRLGLGDNQIEDVTPLAGLTNLKKLYLSDNQIEDLSPLSGLTNLTTLYLDGNQILDLTPLVGLTNLTKLCLDRNHIEDLSPLSGLTNLTTLYLDGNQIPDLTPLAGLTNLTELWLRFNQIEGLFPLVANSRAGGLGEGNYVNVQSNYLDLAPGSADMADIQTLIDRGVTVEYRSQGALDNDPPTANAGPDQTITDTDGNGQENVTLDGSASCDSDESIASWVWTEGGRQIATGMNPTLTLSVGTHKITLTVTDDKGAANTNARLNTPPLGLSRDRIAFVSDRDGNMAEIYMMNADGSNVDRLTYTPGGWASQSPTWSPDGRKIAFISGGDWDGDGYVGLGLCIMDADGTNVRQIRVNTNFPMGYMHHLAWSPDGARLAFVACDPAYENFDVYTMNIDGSDVRKLTTDGKSFYGPSWSPDSKYIAFYSDRNSDGNGKIYIMAADGSNQRWLSNAPFWCRTPVWSPDGTKFACGDSGIVIMNIDGSNLIKLTDNPVGDKFTWSPTGAKIAFVSNRHGNNEIYVINADGNDETNLTNDNARNWEPAWSPALPSDSNSSFDSEVEFTYDPQCSLDDEVVITVQPAVNLPPNTTIETAEIDESEGRASFTWTGNDDTTGTEDLVYDFRLLNPDSAVYNWSGWSSQRAKTYTNLPAGSYRFEVRAKDGDGEDDPSPASREFSISQASLNCVIHLRSQDVEASMMEISEFTTFDIYVGASTGDVSQVRFSSDESLDGTPSGKWTKWYDWNSNGLFSPWDAVAKTMEWSFPTGGNKEVWSEITNGNGSSDTAYAYMLVQVPEWRKDLRVGDILYDPCALRILPLVSSESPLDTELGHVGIYTGDGYTVDAQRNACRHPITNWDARDHVQILRVYRSGRWAEKEAKAAADWARDLCKRIGNSYSYQWPAWRSVAASPEALGVRYPGEPERDPRQDETKWYCSELVWAAYYNCGVNLKPGEPDSSYNEHLPVSPENICRDDDTKPVGGHSHGLAVQVPKNYCSCSQHASVVATCPVDLVITDPDGQVISRSKNDIGEATYWMDDLDGDGSIDVLVRFKRKAGTYLIEVRPRPEAKPTDQYTLVFEDHSTSKETTLADQVAIKDIPDAPYQVDVSFSESGFDIDQDGDALFGSTTRHNNQVKTEPLVHTITATAGSNGAIDPAGHVTVTRGTDKTFAITPNTGYVLLNLWVDGKPAEMCDFYTFANVSTDHTIHITFAREAIPEKREQPIWWWLGAAAVVLLLSGVALIRLRCRHR